MHLDPNLSSTSSHVRGRYFSPFATPRPDSIKSLLAGFVGSSPEARAPEPYLQHGLHHVSPRACWGLLPADPWVESTPSRSTSVSFASSIVGIRHLRDDVSCTLFNSSPSGVQHRAQSISTTSTYTVAALRHVQLSLHFDDHVFKESLSTSRTGVTLCVRVPTNSSPLAAHSIIAFEFRTIPITKVCASIGDVRRLPITVPAAVDNLA